MFILANVKVVAQGQGLNFESTLARLQSYPANYNPNTLYTVSFLGTLINVGDDYLVVRSSDLALLKCKYEEIVVLS